MCIIYNKVENLDSTKAKTIKILAFLDSLFFFFFEIYKMISRRADYSLRDSLSNFLEFILIKKCFFLGGRIVL